MRSDNCRPLRTWRILRLVSRYSAAFLLICLIAQAQSTTGIVTGVVSDPDNRPIPSARIVFLNVETGQKQGKRI